jgi:hypothetical protein
MRTTDLEDALRSFGAALSPLFAVAEDRMAERAAAAAAATGADLSGMPRFYRVEAQDASLDDLAVTLGGLDLVEAAYVKPPGELPVLAPEAPAADAGVSIGINAMSPSLEEPPLHTPDFTPRQGYLDPAPGGVDARYAWMVGGGRGAGVQIIDLEWGWRFTHEDLRINQGGVVAGVNASDTNHGTAVLGEISGDRNAFGITGICPDAVISAVAFSLPTATAIRIAADRLRPGDILLLEIHRAGPRFNFTGRADQRGYIAIEWWPDDFAAILYATGRGVIVVEAAGNGAENFDDAIYNTRPAGFPATWRNPLTAGGPDSGAIIVGAGAPPPGTHGVHTHGPDRSRLDFSNHGSRVDAQGWGREVTSCGYGDLQGGANQDEWYTDRFSGTSSASPIVVGAVGCLQGILRARGQTPLTPAQARSHLRATGSPQTDAVGRPASQRIGNRPDLRQLIARLPGGGVVAGVRTTPLYRYWNPSGGDHFYTTNWSELGSGRHGWSYEGVQCHVVPRRVTGAVPLYRYWNPSIVDHFYTTNWSELGYGRYGWLYEGIQCWVFPGRVAGSVPLYRYWNPGIGDHFYTTNWSELGFGRHGWHLEGIQCYVFPSPVSVPPSAETPFAESLALALESRAGAAMEPLSGMAAFGPGGVLTSLAEPAPADVAPPSFAADPRWSPEGDGRALGASFDLDPGAAAGLSSFEVQVGNGVESPSFRLLDGLHARADGGGEVTFNVNVGRSRV